MIYKEFGNRDNPTIILLHGEYLSWWSFKDIIDFLVQKYHVVSPVINGHGEDSKTAFHTIQECAQDIIKYIDDTYQGKVHAICGVSLGAQITIEILSRRSEIAEYAIVQSISVVPSAIKTSFIIVASKLLYKIFRQKYLAKIISKRLCIREEMFSQYYQDSLKISYKSWINIKRISTEYSLPSMLDKSKAKVLIIVGTEEIKAMDKSVRLIMKTIPKSYVCIVPEMKRGELSLINVTEYLTAITNYVN